MIVKLHETLRVHYGEKVLSSICRALNRMKVVVRRRMWKHNTVRGTTRALLKPKLLHLVSRVLTYIPVCAFWLSRREQAGYSTDFPPSQFLIKGHFIAECHARIETLARLIPFWGRLMRLVIKKTRQNKYIFTNPYAQAGKFLSGV